MKFEYRFGRQLKKLQGADSRLEVAQEARMKGIEEGAARLTRFRA